MSDQKTVSVEQIDGVGRAIVMNKYQVDEHTGQATVHAVKQLTNDPDIIRNRLKIHAVIEMCGGLPYL